MNVRELIASLSRFPENWNVLACNKDGNFRLVEGTEKDDNYNDILIVSGERMYEKCLKKAEEYR